MRVSFEESAAQPYLAQENAPEDGSFQSFSDRALFRPIAFAPIRIRPKRTYDPIQDLPDPSGIHVPMILARIRATDSTSWERIARMLRRLAKPPASCKISRSGGSARTTIALQVEVKIHGKSFNLMDVGYGVSQILPILVECARAPREAIFLLQQPEVHLHPRAQAELGSFFATLAVELNQQFLIETHSDHLVDRLRLEIRNGRLDPQQLAVLYFERDGTGARIHSMSVDQQGNLLDSPAGYRQFFLDEERRLFGL